MVKMEIEKLITIIIPTHNRSEYAKRSVKYYRQELTPIPLQICDSSKEKNLFLEQELGLNYHHSPENSFAEKVNFALQKVQTPYVMLIADDDFFTLTGIKASVDFLNKHADYSTAQGTYTRFVALKNELILFPIYENGLSEDFENNSKAFRVAHLMNSYYPLFYAIQRTEVMRKTYSALVENKISNLNLVEFSMAIIPTCLGKVKMLPRFYCAREHIFNSAGFTTESFISITKNEKFKEEYERFLKMISAFVFENETDFSKAKTEKIFLPYLNKVGLSSLKKATKIIRQLLPKAIEQKIIANQQQKNIFSKIAQYQLHQGFPYSNEEAKMEWERMKKYL